MINAEYDNATVAIDAGSRWVKIISGSCAEWKIIDRIDTARFYRDYCLREDAEGAGDDVIMRIDHVALGLPEDARLVVTGYGRTSQALSGAAHVNEIIAHVAGAAALTGLSEFTLLDIGGQDTKVARVVDGRLGDFETNDRCAASCGRFLENISVMLGFSFEEISAHYDSPEALNSTCAVFAETEVIERLARGVRPEQIAAGVNMAVFKRIEPMLRRFSCGKIVFSGGVARGEALARIIENELGVHVIKLDEPEFTGAVGCLAIEEEC